MHPPDPPNRHFFDWIGRKLRCISVCGHHLAFSPRECGTHWRGILALRIGRNRCTKNTGKLTGRPFENHADDRFYYPAETHQAALLKLHYAIEHRRAAALLCGPGGIGKTLVANSLGRRLNDEFSPVCHLVFPAMSAEQLIRYLADQLTPGRADDPREPSADLMRLERFLLSNLEQNRHAVVVIDEAHLLEEQNLLEPLRLLLNVAANQAPGESAWTLVLVGQPMLLSHVERYRSLDERLSVKCMLNRFLPEETTAYVQHRLREAGADAEELFELAALERIHALTDGIPRRVNRLCDLALMVGYAEDRDIVSADVIENVNSDLAAPAL